MMSPPLEHDYIGSAFDDRGGGGGSGRSELNLKATELRLGLPGSEYPGRNVPPSLGPLSGAKRGFSDAIDGEGSWPFSGGKGSVVESGKGISAAKDSSVAAALDPSVAAGLDRGVAPAAKAQVVGWPPIRSYRKNTMAANPVKNKEDADSKQGSGCLYVKVSMDGAPYLRKVDLKTYGGYKELLLALEKMFSGFTIGQCGGQGMPGRDGLSESRLIDLLNGSEYVLTYEDKDGDWMLVGDVPWEMFSGSCRRMRIMKGSDAIGLAPRDKEKCKNKN